MYTYAICVVVLMLILYFVYKYYYGTERLSQPVTVDVCSGTFGPGEEFRGSVVNAVQRTYEQWSLVAVGLPAGTSANAVSTAGLMGNWTVTQGTINTDGSYQPSVNVSKQLSAAQLRTFRTILYSKPMANVTSGVYMASTMLQNDGVVCSKLESGWVWTFAQPNKCITRDCSGRVPATDGLAQAILGTCANIPGYRSMYAV
jgi:hypothetical protein